MGLDIAGLYQGGKIHQSVYTDAELFEREKRLLFGKAWLYVGHESQLKAPGDFITSELVGQPLLLVRGDDGEVRAFFNRCSHRGALIAKKTKGTAKTLACSYHSWCFGRDGRLESIPFSSGYDGSEILRNRAQYGLTPVPRFASYRGFLFASLACNGPDLPTFLGPAAINLDNMIERAPDGEIEVWGSPFRMMKRNNWKVYLENLHDGAHALPTHISSIRAAQRVIDQAQSEWTKLQAYIVAANSQSPDSMAKITVQCYPRGHSDMMAFRKTRSDVPEQCAYEDALARRVGKDGVERILGIDRHNAVIYPTLSVQPNWMQLRLIVPLTVDTTRVDVWTFALKGAGDWINRRIRTFSNTIHSPASLVRADDLENYERVQNGLKASFVPEVSAHREIARDSESLSSAMSERYIRNQFEAWLDYMGGV